MLMALSVQANIYLACYSVWSDEAEDELGPGSLFSTGLVAGGALAGVIYAMFAARMESSLATVNFAERITASIGEGSFALLGVAFFAVMGGTLYWIATRETPAD